MVSYMQKHIKSWSSVKKHEVFKVCYVNLLIWNTEWQRQRGMKEKDREEIKRKEGRLQGPRICWFIPQMITNSQGAPGQSQQPRTPAFPTCVAEIQILKPLVAVSRMHIGWKLDGKQTRRDYKTLLLDEVSCLSHYATWPAWRYSLKKKKKNLFSNVIKGMHY